MVEMRTATVGDAALIRAQREAMFRDMGRNDDAALAAMSSRFEPWVATRLADGRYMGWIAEEDGSAVAGAGLLLLEWPAHVLDPEGETRGYILNVYVAPTHRRRGLAKALTQACLQECTRRGIAVVTLHASEAGRPVYEGLGFRQSNEMQLLAPR